MAPPCAWAALHSGTEDHNVTQLDVLEDALARVDRTSAPLIVEVANGPITGDVDGVLAKRGARVVPDVLANAGGVVVSYFEWVQNRQGYPWTLDEVRNRLEAMLVQAFDDMWSIHESEGATLRAAAYTVAMRRIGEAIALQGRTSTSRTSGVSPPAPPRRNQREWSRYRAGRWEGNCPAL
jgi:hypothetical protein